MISKITTMASKQCETLEFSRIEDYIEEPWDIIGSYFKGHHLKQLVRHQVESYNDFVTIQIQRTIDMFNPVQVHSEHDYNKEFNKYGLDVRVLVLSTKISISWSKISSENSMS